VAARRVEGPRPVDREAKSAGDETILAQRAGDGDASAFRTLVERHLPVALAIGRRMLRDDAEAEDVAQEAFLRLWRSAGTLDIGVAGVKPWIRRVVSNLCIDRSRARSRLTVTDEVPEVPDAPRQLANLEDEELKQRVDRALKSLPERQRLALTLFHFEGLSQIEIGAEMGISDEAVESLLARARRQLKADLKSEWQGLVGGASDSDSG
jgi:RNA polymerase sigma-70 factor, ECF subfamily